MLNRFTLSFVIAWFAFAKVASAATDCETTLNQLEMNACASQRWDAADHALNATYKQAMQRLSQSHRHALRTEQRTWLKTMRDTCTRATQDESGGQMWGMLMSSCLTAATEKRTLELKNIR